MRDTNKNISKQNIYQNYTQISLHLKSIFYITYGIIVHFTFQMVAKIKFVVKNVHYEQFIHDDHVFRICDICSNLFKEFAKYA